MFYIFVLQHQINKIEDEQEWMCDNLEGCDWCCEGGDEHMEELNEELKEIRNRIGWKQ